MPSDSKNGLDLAGKELKARMWMEGAKNISLSTTGSTHAIGMDILGQNEPIDIPAIVKEVCTVIENSYVDPDVGKQCSDHLRQQLECGAYDAITDGDAFTEAITADLRSISEDKHIDFYVNPDNAPKAREAAPSTMSTSSTVMPPQYPVPPLLDSVAYKAPTNIGWMGSSPNKFPHEIQTGFLDKEHTTGYVDFRIFGVTSAFKTEAQKSDSLARRQAIIDALQHINKAKSIIVDLRNNGGGDPPTVQLLCSLFIEENRPLNTIVYRGEVPKEYKTLSHRELPAEQRLTHQKLLVLISPNTFSAAEEFANDVKVLERGTIIGAPSGGGANPGGPALIGDSDKFVLFIPTGKAFNPIQEGNWEGVGIIPDHMVPAETAVEEALKHI